MVVSVLRGRDREWFLHIDIACCTASVGRLARVYVLGRSARSASPAITTDQCQHPPASTALQPVAFVKMLTEYTYVFAIGTFFALLEAYNNGANDGYEFENIRPLSMRLC